MSLIPQDTKQKLIVLNKFTPTEFETFCENSVASLVKGKPQIVSMEMITSNI